MKNKNHYVLFSYSDCLHVLTLIAYNISQKTSYCKDPPKLSTYTCSFDMWKSISALTVSTIQSSGPRSSRWAPYSPQAQDPHNEHQTVLRPKILTMSTRQSSGPRPSWWAPVLRPKTNFVRTSKFFSFYFKNYIKIFKDSFGPVNSNFHFEDCNISMGNIEPTQDVYY
jgi:hypothetical protein